MSDTHNIDGAMPLSSLALEKYKDPETAATMLTMVLPQAEMFRQLCEDNDVSVAMLLETDSDGWGMFHTKRPKLSDGMALAKMIMDADGNLDGFLLILMENAIKNGHSSVVLDRLGIPRNGNPHLL